VRSFSPSRRRTVHVSDGVAGIIERAGELARFVCHPVVAAAAAMEHHDERHGAFGFRRGVQDQFAVGLAGLDGQRFGRGEGGRGERDQGEGSEKKAAQHGSDSGRRFRGSTPAIPISVVCDPVSRLSPG